MSSNFLSFNPSKTKFIIFGLPQQFFKLNNPTIHLPDNIILSPVDSACNLDVIFDKNMSFKKPISAVSKSCFHNIRDLRRIYKTIYQNTVCPIATSLIRSKILKLTITTLFNTICLPLKLIVFDLSLILLFVMSLHYSISKISPLAQNE